MADIINDIVVEDDVNRLVKGFATVEIVDRQNEIVPIEAFTNAMLTYMKNGGIILYGHENKPVGKVVQWEVMNKDTEMVDVPAISIVGIINGDSKLADTVWDKIKKHEITGFSIGGMRLESEFREHPVSKQQVRVLKKLELNEISLVGIPANPQSLIEATSMAKSSEIMKPFLHWKDFESCVADMKRREGYDDETAKKVCGKLQSQAEKGEIVTADIVSPMERVNQLAKEFEKADYPFSQCLADRRKEGYSEEAAKKICGSIKAKFGKENDDDGMSEKYVFVGGAKDKEGKLVDKPKVEDVDKMIDEFAEALKANFRKPSGSLYEPKEELNSEERGKQPADKKNNDYIMAGLTKCPECGGKLSRVGEVAKCKSCGFSKKYINKNILSNSNKGNPMSKKVFKRKDEEDEREDEEEEKSEEREEEEDDEEEKSHTKDEDLVDVEPAGTKSLPYRKFVKAIETNNALLKELIEMQKANYKASQRDEAGKMPKAAEGRRGDGVEGVGLDAEIVEIPDTKKGIVVKTDMTKVMKGNEADESSVSVKKSEENDISQILSGKKKARDVILPVVQEIAKSRGVW